MKAEQKTKIFVPVIVTLETQEEVDKFYAITNWSLLTTALDIHGWWKELEEFKTGNIEKWHLELKKINRDC